MLFGCPWSKAVWLRLFGREMLELGLHSVDAWLGRSIDPACRGACQETAWHRTMITRWIIWRSRCKLMYDNQQPNVELIVQEVIRTTEERKVTQSEMATPNRPTISRGWERPGADIININCDAAWCANTRWGGIGVLARD